MAWHRAFLVAILPKCLRRAGRSVSRHQFRSSFGPKRPPRTRPARLSRASRRRTRRGAPSRHSTAQPAAEPTSVPVPPKPTGVKFDDPVRLGNDPSVDRDHPDGEVGSAAERGRRDQGLRRDEVHRPAAKPVSQHERALPRRAHPAARVGPQAARHRSGVGWRSSRWTWTGTFDCEVGLAYDPRGAGLLRHRACCLQRVRPVDLCDRRARQMVATRSQRDCLLTPLGACRAASTGS